jgi:hypothetical protein
MVLMSESKSSTIERVLAAGVVMGVAAGSFVVAWFNPVKAGFFPVCPLFQLTGLHCPGCGLTRGFHALFHGDFIGAIDYNILIPLYVLFFGYLTLSLTFTAIRGVGLSWNFLKPWMVYGFLAVSLTFAVLRNLPYFPLNLLAP